MPMYLKITDGTTTIDLLGNDATNDFNLLASEWAPSVANRKVSSFGGDLYETATESLPLYARSTATAATILENLDTLARLMNQARQWNMGANVAPVIIRYSPNSSTDYLQAVILGPPDSGSGVILPPTFSDDLYQNVVDGVILQFRRRGEWLGDASAGSAGTSGTPPAKQFVNFSGSITNASPTDLTISITSNLNEILPDSIYLLMGRDNMMHVFDAQSMTLSGFTSVADSANNASGGSVLRYTPTDTTVKRTNASPVASSYSGRINSVFVNVRNNSASTSFWIRAVTNDFYGGTPTPWVEIMPSTGPKWLNLGLLIIKRSGLAQMLFEVRATAASGTLDIDQGAYIALDTEQTLVQHWFPQAPTSSFTGQTWIFKLEYLKLSSPQANNRMQRHSGGTPLDRYQPYSGTSVFYSSNDQITVSILATGPSYLPTSWRWTNPSGSLVSMSATAERRAAYLVPR